MSISTGFLWTVLQPQTISATARVAIQSFHIEGSRPSQYLVAADTPIDGPDGQAMLTRRVGDRLSPASRRPRAQCLGMPVAGALRRAGNARYGRSRTRAAPDGSRPPRGLRHSVVP